MSPRKEDHSISCSNCKEKTTEIWFSEKGTPLCLICFSIERFEKVDETPVGGTPRKTLNSNPVLRMCTSIEQKLSPLEKKRKSKTAPATHKEASLKKEEPALPLPDGQREGVGGLEAEELKLEPGTSIPKVSIEEKEEKVAEDDLALKKSLRRKKKPLVSDLPPQAKKARAERANKEKAAPADPEAKSRRSLFKQKAFKSPAPKASIFVSDIMYFKGTYFRKGDIVSITDIGGGIFYAQIRGFMQDQYCEKSAAVTWLLPTEDAPPSEEGFYPDSYVFGPEEDLPRKLDYMTFVMHAPSNYFLDRSLPYPEYPSRGHIYTHLHSAKRVLCHTALQKKEIQVPECIVDSETIVRKTVEISDVEEVKSEAVPMEVDSSGSSQSNAKSCEVSIVDVCREEEKETTIEIEINGKEDSPVGENEVEPKKCENRPIGDSGSKSCDDQHVEESKNVPEVEVIQFTVVGKSSE